MASNFRELVITEGRAFLVAYCAASILLMLGETLKLVALLRKSAGQEMNSCIVLASRLGLCIWYFLLVLPSSHAIKVINLSQVCGCALLTSLFFSLISLKLRKVTFQVEESVGMMSTSFASFSVVSHQLGLFIFGLKLCKSPLNSTHILSNNFIHSNYRTRF